MGKPQESVSLAEQYLCAFLTFNQWRISVHSAAAAHLSAFETWYPPVVINVPSPVGIHIICASGTNYGAGFIASFQLWDAVIISWEYEPLMTQSTHHVLADICSRCSQRKCLNLLLCSKDSLSVMHRSWELFIQSSSSLTGLSEVQCAISAVWTCETFNIS